MVNRLTFLFVLLFLPFLIKAQGNREAAIYHTVQKDEWYSKIAPLYNTKVDSLEKWNPNVESNSLTVGQRIIVGWKEVVKEQEHDEKIEKTPETILDAGAKQPKGDTNVPPSSPPREEPKPDPDPTPSPSYSWVWLLFGMVIGLALGVVLFYLLFVKKLKADNRYLEIELNQLKFDLNSEKTSTGSELSRLRSKIQTIEREKQRMLEENVSLGEEIDRLKAAQSRMNENGTEKTRVSINQAAQQASGASLVLYADAIIDDYFVRISESPNEDTIFVLNLNGENSANISIYKPAYPRIVANPSFLEGCEKQILGNTMQLDVTEGKAQRDVSNGKWKVINKLNVIIK